MSVTYSPAWWLPGRHAHTLWGRFFRKAESLPLRTERWDTPDGDFLDLVRLDGAPGSPRLLMLHGLEGTPRSHYVGGMFAEARRRGWAADLMVFRGCGPELNLARRFYHSGETTDLEFVVGRLLDRHPDGRHPGGPLLLAGVSLGGNVLLKWLGERSGGVPERVAGAAAVSVPYDLARGSRHLQRGFARVYERHFLRSLRRKAERKMERFPDLVTRERLAGARTLWDFDDCVTAPVHGFAGAEDYYARSSSLGYLAGVRVPTLLLSAVDDPFLPPEVLDEVREVARGNPCLEPEFVDVGGHVGFVSGANPLRPFYYAEWRVASFLASAAERHAARAGTRR